ncbi:MAG: DUF2764 family protein [Bacteroidales bacterium]|nr:DUF2764 family protein [Bacteroidales bacterium]
MSNYYCLMTGVPSISLDTPCAITYAEFREQCEETLTAADKKLLSYSYLRQDCLNLVSLLRNPEAELALLGNYSETQLKELIEKAEDPEVKAAEGFPKFLFDYIRNSYLPNSENPSYFADDAIMLAYYESAMKCKNPMIADWFKLNFNLSNILTALIARKNGWNVADYIQGGEINEMIKTNKSKDFDLTREYDFVAEIMKIVDTDDPVEKEKKIDAFKWLWLDEMTFSEFFGIEAVFAYLCKLEMQNRWEMLDPEKGKETFTQIIENLRSEAQVPAEFVR